MFYFKSVLSGILSFLLTGIGLFFIVKFFNISLRLAMIVMMLYLVIDILTIPVRADYYSKKGFLNYSIIRYGWYYLIIPSKKRRVIAIGNIVWMLMDLGLNAKAGMFLSKAGNIIDDAPRSYLSSLGRYLVIEDANSNLPISLSESSLNSGAYGRGLLVRGMVLLKKNKIRSALRSFEKCRVVSLGEGDIILNGTVYYYIGVAWDLLGEKNYARDQLLKAEVILSNLPLGKRAAKYR